MWRIAILSLVGCGGHGSTPAIPDGATELETARFTPQLCTSGLPDDPPNNPNPNCPVNVLPMDELGASGARMGFVATALGSGLFVDDLTFTAGIEGLHIEHPQLLRWPAGARTPVVLDPFPGLVIDLPSGSSEPLDPASVVGFVSTDQLSFRFDAVGPLAP
jgi:hypothetical protein